MQVQRIVSVLSLPAVSFIFYIFLLQLISSPLLLFSSLLQAFPTALFLYSDFLNQDVNNKTLLHKKTKHTNTHIRFCDDACNAAFNIFSLCRWKHPTTTRESWVRFLSFNTSAAINRRRSVFFFIAVVSPPLPVDDLHPAVHHEAQGEVVRVHWRVSWDRFSHLVKLWKWNLRCWMSCC